MNNLTIEKTFKFVTRQTLAQWEKGRAVPNIKRISKLKEHGINVDKYVLPTIRKFEKLLSNYPNHNQKEE